MGAWGITKSLSNGRFLILMYCFHFMILVIGGVPIRMLRSFHRCHGNCCPNQYSKEGHVPSAALKKRWWRARNWSPLWDLSALNRLQIWTNMRISPLQTRRLTLETLEAATVADVSPLVLVFHLTHSCNKLQTILFNNKFDGTCYYWCLILTQASKPQ